MIEQKRMRQRVCIQSTETRSVEGITESDVYTSGERMRKRRQRGYSRLEKHLGSLRLSHSDSETCVLAEGLITCSPVSAHFHSTKMSPMFSSVR